MKTTCRDTLTLTLAAVYLAAAAFGHAFHDHGDEGRAAHEYAASCRGGSAEGCYQPSAMSTLVVDMRGREEKSVHATLHFTRHSAHACPVCNFFSHHCVSAGNVELPAHGRLIQTVVRAGLPAVVRACPGPQQPRAPPWFA